MHLCVCVFVCVSLQLEREWEETPPHFTRLDLTALLSDSNIDEVVQYTTYTHRLYVRYIIHMYIIYKRNVVY